MDTTSRRIQDDARAEIASDPRIPHPAEIAVEVDRDRREDAEIRGAALQRLECDSEIPGDAIRVSVKDGWVTLKGDVVFQFQSDEAFNQVASLHGVTGVTNEIRVDEPR
jgi:osmotically-inducible protein OsmY